MQAWEVILACQGQMRFGGMGGVTGIDLQAIQAYVKTQGMDVSLITELVLAAEPEIVSALNTRES